MTTPSATGVQTSEGAQGVGGSAESDFSLRKMTIATACLLGSTFVPYVQATISPLMMLPMIKEFGWTRTEYAFGSTFLFAFGSIMALFYGRIADRVGVRPILLIGAVGGGATMVLLSFQTVELWRFYATYALLGTFGSSGLGYTKVIGALFTRHRGKALALFGAEATVALAVLPILTNFLNSQFGWRGTYVVYGVIMFLLTPMIFFAIKEPGARAESTPGARTPLLVEAKRAPPLEGMTGPEIRRDRVFWLSVLAMVLAGALNVGLTAHIIAAITDKGFSATVAASALSVATLVSLFGAFAGGFALDHFRTSRILSVFGLLSALGVFLFGITTARFGGLPLLILAMTLQNAIIAAILPAATYLLTRFVGLRAFAEAYAIQVVCQGVAMAAAPPLFGMIYDKVGSYAPVYWILIIAAIAGSFLYFVLGPYRYGAEIGLDRRQPSPDESGEVQGSDQASAGASSTN